MRQGSQSLLTGGSVHPVARTASSAAARTASSRLSADKSRGIMDKHTTYAHAADLGLYTSQLRPTSWWSPRLLRRGEHTHGFQRRELLPVPGCKVEILGQGRERHGSLTEIDPAVGAHD